MHQTLSIDGPIPRSSEHGLIEVEPCKYGQLGAVALSDLLGSEPFAEFTSPLRNRCAAERRYRDRSETSGGWGVVALAELEEVYRELGASLERFPFPIACRGCAKQRGW